MDNKQLPNRKNNRFKDFDYSQAGVYFVTICVEDRKPILARKDEKTSQRDVVAGLRHTQQSDTE